MFFGGLLELFEHTASVAGRDAQCELAAPLVECLRGDVHDAVADAMKYRDKTENLDTVELEHWLRRVLKNKVIDFYRRKRVHIHEAELERLEADVRDSFLRIDHLIADTATSPSERLIRQEQWWQLADALQKLEPSYREVVLLRDISGWPLKSIAQKLDCSIGAVAGRLRRGREELCQLIEDSNG